MTIRISRRALACALLATTALSMPAIASAETPAPKFVDTIDDHGVDLATGLPFLTIEEGGIGSGPGRIAMQRIWSEGAGFLDNWSGGLYDVTTNGVTKKYLQFAGISDTFSGSGTSWTSDKADGSTLTYDDQGFATYTASDGTQIVFNSLFADRSSTTRNFNCPGADPKTCQAPTSISYPSGLKFTIQWTDVRLCKNLPGEPCVVEYWYERLSGVTSSAGYSFTVSYATDNAGTGTEPPADWFNRTSVTFHNSANPPSPAPAITYSYPDSSHIDVTDPAGREWVFTTDASNRITGVQRPGSSSNNISYAYGADGTVSSSTKDGVTNSYSRSVAGTSATETRTDPLTHTRVVTADTGIGRPTSDQNELGNTTGYTYDTSARLTQITAPEGNAVQYGYDSRGNVTTTTKLPKPGWALPNIVTSASFDATCSNIVTCNEPNSTTDANGNVTTYAYDPTHGGVTSITQPAPTTGAVQPQTRYSYSQVTSASGDPVYMLTGVSACQTNASCTGTSDETKAVAAYNSNLLPTSVTREDGTGTLAATNAMTYDARGNLLTVDGPLPGTADTTALKYNLADELTGEISPDPDGTGPLPNRAIRVTYRPDGQVSKEELGTTTDQSDAAFSAMTVKQTVDTGFDANSRPVTQQLSAGGTAYALTQADYDALGRVNCTAVRMNTAVYGSLPSSACTFSTQGSFGPDQISQNVYDAAGELTDVKVAVGTADAATERHLNYSANGLLASLLDGENNLTTYLHDGLDRLWQTQYPSSTKGSGVSNANDVEVLTYDSNGNVTQRVVRSGAAIGYSYDHLNRLTFKDLPGTEPDVTYGYDNLGRMTSASQSGIALSFGYDALSRNTTETGPIATVSRTFDLAGRTSQLSTSDGLLFNYQRLVTGEMSAILNSSGTVLAGFTYDDLGQRTGVSRVNGVATGYGYDPVSRLTSLSHDLAGTANDLTKTFGYDPASQITTETRDNDAYSFVKSDAATTSTANGLNELATVNGAAASYDGNGNLTFDPTTGRSFAYDSENELTSSSLGGVTAALTYDPLGRLYQVTSASGARRFLYATGDSGLPEVVGDYDGAGNLLDSYGFGPGPDEPVLWWDISAGAAFRTFQADERGSIIAAADGLGNLVAINKYDEYGVPQGSVTGGFGYTGQLWLPEVGLYYYKARMYSPGLGRFMQTDPIGQADDPNLYAYAKNDPMNLVDPLGLATAAPPPPQSCNPEQNIGGCGTILVTGTRIRNQPCPGSAGSASCSGGPGPTTGPSGPGKEIVVTGPQKAIVITGHHYRIHVHTDCSAGQVFHDLEAPGMSAPGAPQARNGSTQHIQLLGNGGNNLITQVVNPNAMTITNITEPSHQFYPGQVFIQVIPASPSGSNIVITGIGTGPDPFDNDVLGYAFFGGTAVLEASYCAGPPSSPR